MSDNNEKLNELYERQDILRKILDDAQGKDRYYLMGVIDGIQGQIDGITGVNKNDEEEQVELTPQEKLVDLQGKLTATTKQLKTATGEEKAFLAGKEAGLNYQINKLNEEGLAKQEESFENNIYDGKGFEIE